MIDALRTVRQWRETLRAPPELFEEHTNTAASRRTRVAFISTLTAFSLERHRENGDDTQACRISIGVPRVRGDAASAWI